MGMTHAEFLTSHRIFGCLKCQTHLTTAEDLISRQFNGQHGKAFLFSRVVNVNFGEAEDRHMTTGMHTVRDIRCDKCRTVLGWKYVSGMCRVVGRRGAAGENGGEAILTVACKSSPAIWPRR